MMCNEDTPTTEVPLEEAKSQGYNDEDENGIEAVLLQTTVADRNKHESDHRTIGESRGAPSTRVVLSSFVLNTKKDKTKKGDVSEREPKEEPVESKENSTCNSREQPHKKDNDNNEGFEANGKKLKKPKTIWRSYMDSNTNRVYYYNKVTHETTWQRPLDVRIKDLSGVNNKNSTKDAKNYDEKEATKEEEKNQENVPFKKKEKREKTKTTGKVKSNFKVKKARLTVFALGRNRTREGEDKELQNSEAKVDENDQGEEIDVDEVELDVEGSA